MKDILIVEDDPKIARAMQIRLHADGYETTIASDVIQARNQAVQKRRDLIVLDLSLPGGDGLQLAKQLQALPETRQTPIIFVTASKDPGLRAKAMNLGAVGLFEKPYDHEEFRAVVAHALGDLSRFQHQSLPEAHSATFTNPVPHTRKVLVIDDDQKIALALALRLRAAQFEVHIANDALTGLSAAVRLQPDLVLLDISMPAGDGFTLADRLRSLSSTPVPIVFLTASRQSSFRARASELGAAAYFEKPYEIVELISAIETIFAAQGTKSPTS